jgi:hypothetical protein
MDVRHTYRELKSIINRPVRLILIKYVEDKTMMEIKARELQKNERTNLLARVSRLYLIYTHGIYHCDAAPRNIFICCDDFGSKHLRIVVIDFNIAVIRRCIDSRRRGGPERTSPVDFFWYAEAEFSNAGWFPIERVEQRKWLLQQWGDSRKYGPSINQLDDI